MDGRLGNDFWKLRKSHGRKPKFRHPEALRAGGHEYFQWTADNPVYEYRPMAVNKVLRIVKVPHMRVMSISGLRVYLGISRKTWRAYRRKKGFLPIIEGLEAVIYTQQFTGAAAGVLNAKIMSRSLRRYRPFSQSLPTDSCFSKE